MGARMVRPRGGPGLLAPEVLRTLRGHRGTGDRVFLVSGSFFACLDPIAAAARVDAVYGTRPVVRDGVLTGEVLVPVIAEVKARIVQVAAELLGLELARCSAYGDHISDLPMLDTVGRPVVVGGDPALAAVAEARGWPRLLPRP
jgi:HAD superfamily hydrolase (TIGR01490 family)